MLRLDHYSVIEGIEIAYEHFCQISKENIVYAGLGLKAYKYYCSGMGSRLPINQINFNVRMCSDRGPALILIYYDKDVTDTNVVFKSETSSTETFLVGEAQLC